MSRILSQPLQRFLHHHPPAARFRQHRQKSGKNGRVEFIELDIVQASSSQISSPEDVIASGIKRLEDAIHSIVVRRATPDWLPFLPGYSFLVPQRCRAGVVRPAGSLTEVVGKLDSSGSGWDRIFFLDLMSEEESLAFTSARGWPSSSFFVEGSLPMYPIQVVEVELKIQDGSDRTYVLSWVSFKPVELIVS